MDLQNVNKANVPPSTPMKIRCISPEPLTAIIFGRIIALSFSLFAPGQTTLWQENGNKNKLSKKMANKLTDAINQNCFHQLLLLDFYVIK